MYAWQFAKAQSAAPTRFASMQNHYNLVYREEEREMIPQCVDQGVAVLPWRARTDAFGDSLYVPELDRPVVDRAADVAAQRGVPSAQVALAWLSTDRDRSVQPSRQSFGPAFATSAIEPSDRGSAGGAARDRRAVR